MISIICVYNDRKILEDWLLKSLNNQTVPFELITVDNVQGQFKSAARALNHGGNKATGKYLMFIHQDVDLVSRCWLEDTEKILDSIFNLGIAGAMGVSEIGNTGRDRLRNIIRHGYDGRRIGNLIQKPEPVQTLDELLLIIPKDIFQKYQFDEQVCEDWHLYGVEFCLNVGCFGLGVYAIPIFVIHKSEGASIKGPLYSLPVILNLGPMVKEYYRTLNKVLKKHKNNYKWIYTTCGHGKWSTREPLILQRIYHLAREYLKGIWNKLKKLIG